MISVYIPRDITQEDVIRGQVCWFSAYMNPLARLFAYLGDVGIVECSNTSPYTAMFPNCCISTSCACVVGVT